MMMLFFGPGVLGLRKSHGVGVFFFTLFYSSAPVPSVCGDGLFVSSVDRRREGSSGSTAAQPSRSFFPSLLLYASVVRVRPWDKASRNAGFFGQHLEGAAF